MNGSEFERYLKFLSWLAICGIPALLVTVPLAIWKLVDIFFWLTG